MKRLFTIALAVLAALASVGIATPAHAFTGGDVSSNLTLTKAGSPYKITSTIRVGFNSKLIIEPGVEIIGTANPVFQVGGLLNVTGSFAEPVVIKPSAQLVTFVGDNAAIGLSHAHIIGGQAINFEAAESRILDSEFVNQTSCGSYPGFNEFKAGKNHEFDRNVLKNACGFRFDVNLGIFTPTGDFEIRDNLFIGKSKSPAWVNATSLWKDGLKLTGNEFRDIDGTTAITQGFFPTTVSANNNYWGAKTLEQVRGSIPGTMGDIFKPADIILGSLLSAPSAATPKDSKAAPPVIETPGGGQQNPPEEDIEPTAVIVAGKGLVTVTVIDAASKNLVIKIGSKTVKTGRVTSYRAVYKLKASKGKQSVKVFVNNDVILSRTVTVK